MPERPWQAGSASWNNKELQNFLSSAEMCVEKYQLVIESDWAMYSIVDFIPTKNTPKVLFQVNKVNKNLI